jgi:hypothetical protein
VARSIDASIDWREGTVMSLPVKDQESFSHSRPEAPGSRTHQA